MNSACQRYREELHDPRDGHPTSRHSRACPDCAAYAARAERAVREVGGLERFEAPDELEGLVVAALNAGAREGRAVQAVSRLARQVLPEELERAVETEAEIAAGLSGPLGRAVDRERVLVPSVLDRLVQEELSDPVKATVRRAVSSLPRQTAPTELDARVHADLLLPQAAERSPFLGRRLALVVTSLAAAVLALLVLRPSQGPRVPSFRLEAATLEDLDSLDPFAREVVSSLGGGLLSTREP